jgi:hypothetical protein
MSLRVIYLKCSVAGTVVVGTYKQGTAVMFQSATGTHLQNENNDIHLLDSFIMYSLLTTLYQELKTIKHPMK